MHPLFKRLAIKRSPAKQKGGGGSMQYHSISEYFENRIFLRKSCRFLKMPVFTAKEINKIHQAYKMVRVVAKTTMGDGINKSNN